MDVTTVAKAVTTLRKQGQPVSVRNVHRLTGGSFRDISRILRALQPSPLAGSQASTAPPNLLEELAQPALSPEAAGARRAYWATAEEVERLRTQDWRRSPYSPGMVYDPAVRKLEALRKKCLALGVDPER